MLNAHSLQRTPSVSQSAFTRRFSSITSRQLRDIPRMENTSSSTLSRQFAAFDHDIQSPSEATSTHPMHNIYKGFEEYQQSVPLYKNSIKYSTNIEGVHQLLPRHGGSVYERGKLFLENRNIDGLENVHEQHLEQQSQLQEEMTELRSRASMHQSAVQGMADNVVYDMQLLYNYVARNKGRPDCDLQNQDYSEIIFGQCNQAYNQSLRESIRHSVELRLRAIMPQELVEHVKIDLYGSSYTNIASISSDIDMSVSGLVPTSTSDGATLYDRSGAEAVLLETKYSMVEHAAMLECVSGSPTPLSKEMRKLYDNDVVGTPLHTKKRNMVQRLSRFFDTLKQYNAQFLAPPRIRHPLVILKLPVPVTPYVSNVDAVGFNLFAGTNVAVDKLVQGLNTQYFRGTEFEHDVLGNQTVCELHHSIPSIVIYTLLVAKDASKAKAIQSYLGIPQDHLDFVKEHMAWLQQGCMPEAGTSNSQLMQEWQSKYQDHVSECLQFVRNYHDSQPIKPQHSHQAFKYRSVDQVSSDLVHCVSLIDAYLEFFPDDTAIHQLLSLKLVDKWDGQVYTSLRQMDAPRRKQALYSIFRLSLAKECQHRPAKQPSTRGAKTVECDLSQNNTLGVLNSQQLKAYMNIDPRVGPLTMLVKEWAKSQHLHGARDGFLSSYAFNLLVIFYLQQKAILPVLQRYSRLDPESPKHIASRTIVGFYNKNDIVGSGLHDQSSIIELFYGFMKYFAEFQWDKHVVSIRHGAPIDHSFKMRYHWDQMKSNFLNTTNDSSNVLFMSLEDPFDMKHDLFRQCRGSYFDRLQNAFRRTSYQLRNVTLDLEANTLGSDIQRSYREYILKQCPTDARADAELAYRATELATVGIKGDLDSAPNRMRWLHCVLPPYLPRYNVYEKKHMVHMDDHNSPDLNGVIDYNLIQNKMNMRTKPLSAYEYSDPVTPMHFARPQSNTDGATGIHRRPLKHAGGRASSNQYIDPTDMA